MRLNIFLCTFISRTSNSKYKQKVIKIEGKQLISYVLGTFFLQLKEKQVIKELKEQSVIHQQTQHSNKRYRIICTSSFWLEKQMKKDEFPCTMFYLHIFPTWLRSDSRKTVTICFIMKCRQHLSNLGQQLCRRINKKLLACPIFLSSLLLHYLIQAY